MEKNFKKNVKFAEIYLTGEIFCDIMLSVDG